MMMQPNKAFNCTGRSGRLPRSRGFVPEKRIRRLAFIIQFPARPVT